jgi:subtilisin-like proprotein convertase family protein
MSMKRAVLLFCLMAAASALALLTIANAGDAAPRYKVVTKRFSNTAAIEVPDSGQATPYPSEIEVSGLNRGKISDVNLSLNNLSHTFPDDVDVLLVGPRGQNAVVMSDVGGGTDVSNITLTLDDAATTALPDKNQLQSGRYQPNNRGPDGDDAFPDPAPAASGGESLAVFNRTQPNGTWQLFVVDDEARDIGEFAGGWTLTIKAKVRR